jgi:predicted TIM-barrel fold metal-dependent hydrolase
MPSRRDVLLALAASGAALLRGRGQMFALPTDGLAPRFPMPAGACDCHVHVFCDPRRFPMSAERTYTPPIAPVESVLAHLHTLGLDRVVIVSASVYGTDNDCALDAIRTLGARARGVANVAPDASVGELDRLGQGGIRGIRLNFETQGVTNPRVAIERFQQAAKQAAGQGWHLQLNTRLPIVAATEELILDGPVTVVFDHFAQANPTLGVDQPGFAALVRLLKSGRAYVKISGAYRLSTRAPDYSDVAPLAQALIAANPERVLWGSDWPHPDSARRTGRSPMDIAPPLRVDDARMLEQLAAWAPDSATRHTILVENPARLYGF